MKEHLIRYGKLRLNYFKATIRSAAGICWIPGRRNLLGLLGLSGILLLSSLAARGQGTTTVTSNPANGASGVSVSANIVFTFSAAMDTASTTSTFISTTPFGSYPVTEVWSAGDTVLTCAPMSPFPVNVAISWFVAGQDAVGGQVFTQGNFTTGTGGGGGTGSGTNAVTTFAAGKIYFYEQLAGGPPTPMTDIAYGFTASTSLASNRVATAVTVTVPGTSSGVSMTQNLLHHEDYSYFTWSTNQTAFASSYPQGDYVFNVAGTPANLQGTVTLPLSMAQPNAPHVANFSATQTVKASQAFTLSWDAFQNGTAADFITVGVDDDLGKTVFQTPGPGTNGALIGTATSVTIPAGTLVSTATNSAVITFYRVATTTNASYASLAFRATETQFGLITTGSIVATTPVVSNPVSGPGGFGFDVSTTVNQMLVIRHSTDLSIWQTLFTTNSPGTGVHITVPVQAGAKDFFRVQNGP
jgi:hypothetical protein